MADPDSRLTHPRHRNMTEIKAISPTRRNLLEFVKFPIRMYRGNTCYVPPLVIDEAATLNPAKNPAFDFCTGQCFLAKKNGRTAGRICAMINRQINERTGVKTARFGFFDFIDDPEVSAALLNAAEEWARKQGMTEIIGPLGFTDLDREGLLTFGFDELGTMATNYNFPYYEQHVLNAGYKPDSEWLEFVMDVPDDIPERMNRVADIVKQRTGLKVKKFTDKKAIKEQYGRAIFELINETYDKLYGFSPLTDRQIDSYINEYLSLLDLDLVSLIVDADDKLVGVGISMPSLSRGLQRSRGKLLPFGWIPLLKGLRGKNDRVDLMLVGIKPEYQGKGVNALLFQDLIPYYIKRGFKWAESNPELADNGAVQDQWRYFTSRQHRRRRAYKKTL